MIVETRDYPLANNLMIGSNRLQISRFQTPVTPNAVEALTVRNARPSIPVPISIPCSIQARFDRHHNVLICYFYSVPLGQRNNKQQSPARNKDPDSRKTEPGEGTPAPISNMVDTQRIPSWRTVSGAHVRLRLYNLGNFSSRHGILRRALVA